jgi:HK97 gp10 family phage protein
MTVQLKGADELRKALRELAPKIQANVIRGGLRAGAKVIMKSAQEKVPTHLGILKSTISIGTSLRDGVAKATVRAGSRVKGGGRKGAVGAERGAFYYAMVEFGTKPHEILPKNGKSLFFAGFNGSIVHHPGAKPKPFMRPAMDENIGAAMAAVGVYINKKLGTAHGLDTPDPELAQDDKNNES